MLMFVSFKVLLFIQNVNLFSKFLHLKKSLMRIREKEGEQSMETCMYVYAY